MSISIVLYSAFLLTTFLIGAFASRRIGGIKDYYIAGGQMPWYMICGTLIASGVSAGLFLGATDMAAQNGYALWASYATSSIGYLVALGVIGVLVKRLASKHEIYDFADILAVRYPTRRTSIRRVIAVIMPLVYIPAMAAQFMALAAISGTIFGVSYEVVLVIVVAIIILFTLLGGMLGVVWTDAFQFLVLTVGLIIAVPLGMSHVGDGDMAAGWTLAINSADNVFDWETPGWPWYAAAGQLMWVFAMAVQPHMLTRFLTAKDEMAILKALPVCLVLTLIIYASTIPIGLLGGVYEVDLAAGEHYYVTLAVDVLGPWIGTMALIGIAAASISTSSTILMVTAQALSRDVIEPVMGGNVSAETLLKISRFSVVIIGIAAALIAFTKPLSIFWLIMLSTSLLGATFFIPIAGGFITPRASGKAALVAMIVGATATTVVFTVNKATGAHWFVHEFFAGFVFSLIAWLIMIAKYPAQKEERMVAASLVKL